MRKMNKGELAKQAEFKVEMEFSSKIDSARNVFNKMAGTLKKQIRPVFRSKPNDRIKIGSQYTNEEGGR